MPEGHRERAILMLLASGPAARCEIARDTGWGVAETGAVVDAMILAGQIAVFPGSGNNAAGGRLLCLPHARAEALDLNRQETVRRSRLRMRRIRAAEASHGR